MSTKKKYVNEDIDGYKEENQSPLAPAWLFSGKQNEGKFLKGGPNGFVVWGSGGGQGGTTNYNELDNKPQINGTELIGNISLAYVKTASISNEGKTLNLINQDNVRLQFTPYLESFIKNAVVEGTKLTLTKVAANQPDTTIVFEINVEQIKNSIIDEINTFIQSNYYTKTEINALLQNYFTKNEILDSFYTKSQINGSFYTKSAVDDKTSSEQHYLKNKAQLKQGEYIQLTKDDANKTITIAQSVKPDPEAPTTGIIFKDDAMNDYVILNQNDVFDSRSEGDSHDRPIAGRYAYSGESYSSPRVLFNPSNPIIVNSDVLNQAKNNDTLGFFKDCPNLNTPIDLSQTTKYYGWDETGMNFLYGCIKFNSTIKFNGLIEKIHWNFMYNCEKFNNLLIDLFTPNLKAISKNFMEICSELAQDFDFSNTGLNDGKINLTNFMYRCDKMGGHTITLGTAGLSMLKKLNYTVNEFSDIYKCFASSISGSSLATDGINLISSNATAEQAHDFVAQDENGNTVKPLQSSITNPFKKLKVNGEVVEGA